MTRGRHRVQDLVDATIADLVEQADVEGPADHRGDGEDVVGSVGELGQAPTEHVANAFRQPEVGQVPGEAPSFVALFECPLLHQAGQQLTDEEGVSTRRLAHRARQLPAVLLELVAGRSPQDLHHLVVVEPGQRDVDRVEAMHVRQGHAQGMTAIDIGVPVGAGYEHRHTVQCPEEVEQHGEGRAGGPVQIVEDEEQRLSPRCPPHRGDHTVEELDLGSSRVPSPVTARGQLGQEPAKPFGDRIQHLGDQQAPQRLDERLVRERGQFVAPPVRNQGPVVMDLFRQRRQEAGLADPRLAGDQRQPTRAGAGRRPCLTQER